MRIFVCVWVYLTNEIIIQIIQSEVGTGRKFHQSSVELVPGQASFTRLTHDALNSLDEVDKLRSCKLVPSNFPTLAQESVALNQEGVEDHELDQWLHQFAADLLNPSDSKVGFSCPPTVQNSTPFTREDSDAARLARRTMVQKTSLPQHPGSLRKISESPDWYTGYSTDPQRLRVFWTGKLIELELDQREQFEIVHSKSDMHGEQSPLIPEITNESKYSKKLLQKMLQEDDRRKHQVSNISKELLDRVIQDRQKEDDRSGMWSSSICSTQEQSKKVNMG